MNKWMNEWTTQNAWIQPPGTVYIISVRNEVFPRDLAAQWPAPPCQIVQGGGFTSLTALDQDPCLWEDNLSWKDGQCLLGSQGKHRQPCFRKCTLLPRLPEQCLWGAGLTMQANPVSKAICLMRSMSKGVMNCKSLCKREGLPFGVASDLVEREF